MTTPCRFLLDGASQSYEPGDTIAMDLVRVGEHPGSGGTRCLAGNCGNCVALGGLLAWPLRVELMFEAP